MAKNIRLLFWTVCIIFTLVGCNLQGNRPVPIIRQTVSATDNGSKGISENSAPVAVVALDGLRLEFACLDGSPCISDIDLSQFDNIEQPCVLYRMYYWDSSTVYAMIVCLKKDPPFTHFAVHINPTTGMAKATEVPEVSNILPEMIVSAVTGGRLVLASSKEDIIYLVDRDLTITPVALGTGINGLSTRAEGLIETNDREVIAYNRLPIEKDGANFLEMARIDVVSGKFTYHLLDLPPFEIPDMQTSAQAGKRYFYGTAGVSPDLKQVYIRYWSGDAPDRLRLGTFDLQSGTEVASTDDYWLVNPILHYFQYRNVLYYSHFPCPECAGGPFALLIDMPAITSRLNLADVKAVTDAGKKFTVTPFGDFFLLDQGGKVVIQSPSGYIVATYFVPESWINRAPDPLYLMTYQLVEYRR